MSKPYTYKIKFIPTGQYYYGVRWAKGCSPEDLWKTYFTSSRHIKDLIETFGADAFTYKVMRTFETKEAACEHERKLLERVKASKNGKFINKANNMPPQAPVGLKVIHSLVTFRETFHDPKLPLPEGWIYGASPSHKVANSNSHIGQLAWNKGKELGPTKPCTEERRSNISSARLKTKKVECEFCKELSDPGIHKKYHGSRCQQNPGASIDDIATERSAVGRKSYEASLRNGTHKPPKPVIGEFTCPHCLKEGSNFGTMQRWHFDRCKLRKAG